MGGWHGRIYYENGLFFQEGEEDGEDDEDERYNMVPSDTFALEHRCHDDGEDGEGDGFLDDFELHEREGAAGNLRTEAVGRYHETVFEQRHTPRECDDGDERPVGDEFHLLQLEIAIPCKGHEYVRANQQQDGEYSF